MTNSKKLPHDDIKAKLIKNIEVRERLYKQDKCRLGWALLKEKSLGFAKNLGRNEFQVSGVLKSGNTQIVF
jgi:hypothetical protein